ncbi:unnamed protein product [Effrenium voratum]|uniref:Uncharacterized protein n=1 Tax=Effrenium voratum TaxID=2562239 RepID=A0AA36IID2_9DINO|nr:unnamed protein product [Effrenium voratum]
MDGGWALDPSDPLLTVEEAAVDEKGRLRKPAYVKFTELFNQEPRDRSQHPMPEAPGTRAAETKNSSMRCWEDAKGAGWVAVGKGTSAWFSLSTWKSWRLCFLLAQLQQSLWERNAGKRAAEVVEVSPVKITD